MSGQSLARRLAAYGELTKPTITGMVLVSTALGYYLSTKTTGAGWDPGLFLRLMLGAAFTAGGVATLNEYLERHIDGNMRRTRGRPLPSGRLGPREALLFGLGISVAGLGILTLTVHPLTGLLASITLVIYIGVYTPLKRHTAWNTAVGAVPGALPPIGGWVAASGTVPWGAWALFAILFFWQIPHFMAIARIYRVDYARAGMIMLPGIDPSGRRTARVITGSCAALLAGSLVPAYLGMTGWAYFFGAGLLGLILLAYGLSAGRRQGSGPARRLLFASILYLPALLAMMVVDLELFP
ncbi:MAG: heme o synthase [Candidatus Neomarinimicrobiota bacterium]